MAAFPISIPGLAIDVRRISRLPVEVQTSVNGSELRLCRRGSTIYDFELKFNFLRQDSLQSTYDELAELLDFFLARQGKYGWFTILDPVDSVYKIVRFADDYLTVDQILYKVWTGGTVKLVGIVIAVPPITVAITFPPDGYVALTTETVTCTASVSCGSYVDFAYLWVSDGSSYTEASPDILWDTVGSYELSLTATSLDVGTSGSDSIDIDVVSDYSVATIGNNSTTYFDYAMATELASGSAMSIGGWKSTVLSKKCYLFNGTTWAETGSMHYARFCQGNAGMTTRRCAKLADGRILVAGNTSALGEGVTAEIYDPDTGTWGDTGSMTTERSIDCQLTTLPNGKVLVFGGWSRTDVLNHKYEIYDPDTGVWTNHGDVAGMTDDYGRTPCCTLLSDGRVFFYHYYVNRISIYNPTLDTWTIKTPSISLNTASQPVEVIPGVVLLFGVISSDMRKVVYYNLSGDSWGYKTSSTYSTQYGLKVKVGVNKVACTGPTYNGIQLYNAVSDSWSYYINPQSIISYYNSHSGYAEFGHKLLRWGTTGAPSSPYGYAEQFNIYCDL
jgi:hypothetical protein